MGVKKVMSGAGVMLWQPESHTYKIFLSESEQVMLCGLRMFFFSPKTTPDICKLE